MINEITKAILKKHGPFTITFDKDDRYGIKKIEERDSDYRYWAFSFISCLIRLLAEDKK